MPGLRAWHSTARSPATWTSTHRPWFLVGCARSREIHRWCYGDDAPNVDVCRTLATQRPTHAALLTKCCLLEDDIEVAADGGGGAPQAVVPWGASLDQVHDALRSLARAAMPAWAPA